MPNPQNQPDPVWAVVKFLLRVGLSVALGAIFQGGTPPINPTDTN